MDGRRLRLSNLEKVLYPGDGTTKGEVIDYYRRVAPLLLPHLRGRPVTRKRWPEGTDHPPFFAKDLERGAPAWIRRLPIDHSSGAKEYPLIDDLASLVYLAQVASLELHVPQWRFDRQGVRAHPDRLVLDLDPGPGAGLAECAVVARWARAILVDLGMDPVPVTSGSKGLHLYCALDASRPSEVISAFARELARALEADHPELVVSTMATTARPGKVLVDWSQNNGAKTTIAPYSLRGLHRPMVAAPRTWGELDDAALAQLDLLQVSARLDLDPLARLAPPVPAALQPYLDKRNAGRTPEPLPPSPVAVASHSDRPRFVVQEHHASRVHFDLRLERDGVLVSWAVPRGIPDSVDRNHLAVMTEPHPLDYLTFSGSIPKGEYGAGSMTVWDAGTYHADKWRDDEVIFTLTGRPDGPLGSGRFALIRTDGTGEKSTWLLHRMKDALGTAKPTVSAGTLSARALTPTAPMLATAASPAQARRAATGWGTDPWVEFKWDGMRARGRWDGTRLRLRARSGTDITARYPELTAADLGLGDLPLDLDGEIVAMDRTGRPRFERLQNRLHLTTPREIEREAVRTPVTYVLFDLLRVGDDDVSSLPLARRRDLLVAATASPTGPVLVPPVANDVDAALETARTLGLEGIVVKDPRSPYRGDRSDRWLKVKLTRTQDVVIGGIRPGRGHRIGSLLVGIPSPDGLRYAGRVGSGFTDADLARLEDALTPATDSPFVGVPTADAVDAIWVHPEHVAEVEFAEFSAGGKLRHARWRGLRPDRTPDQVQREP